MALWTVICFKIPVALRCRDLSVSAKKEKPEEKERGETRMGSHQLIPPQVSVQARLWVGGYFPHLHREQVRQK